jgi:hypothetical protein
MSSVEYWEGEIRCSCGCGDIAQQVHKVDSIPIFIPNKNPAVHIRNYRRRINQQREEARYKLSVLERR